MREERFEIFLKYYYGVGYNPTLNPMKPFLFNSNGILFGGWYYKNSDKNNFYITFKNKDYKEHIEAIVKQENIKDEDLLNTTFSLLRYEGACKKSLYTKGEVYSQYRLIIIHPTKVKSGKILKFEYVQDKNLENNVLLLKSKYLYRDMEECAKDFEMVKLFLNTLVKKYKNKNSIDNLKKICADLELSEQTLFSWKKKNPKVYEAMINGHFYEKISETIDCLSSIPSIQKGTWNCNQLMRYPDGTEL